MAELKKFRVSYEYRGRVSVEIEADSEDEATEKSLSEADESILGCLSVYDVRVEEL